MIFFKGVSKLILKDIFLIKVFINLIDGYFHPVAIQILFCVHKLHALLRKQVKFILKVVFHSIIKILIEFKINVLYDILEILKKLFLKEKPVVFILGNCRGGLALIAYELVSFIDPLHFYCGITGWTSKKYHYAHPLWLFNH